MEEKNSLNIQNLRDALYRVLSNPKLTYIIILLNIVLMIINMWTQHRFMLTLQI